MKAARSNRSAASPRAAARGPGIASGTNPRQTGTIVARGRWLEFAYDLGSGHWSVHGTSTALPWSCQATARVELVTPLGQIEDRDVASAALVCCREEAAGDGAVRCLQICRSWSDGLRVLQQFTFDPAASEFLVELILRPPRQFRPALGSLSPLARPNPREGNLWIGPADWRVLDVGWSATEPARLVPLAPGGAVVATGLAALGSVDLPARLLLGFLDSSQAVGQYALAGLGPESIGLDARADFGTIDLTPGEVTAGPLWLSVARAEEGLPRFVAAWQRRHPREAPAPALVQWQADETAMGRAARPTETRFLDQLGDTMAWPGAPALDAASVGRGWEQIAGDWVADPLRYPHGLRALRDAIRQQDLRAGIQFTPLVVARSSKVFQEQPTWVVRSPAGDPVDVGDGAAETFALDLSQPRVVEWLRGLGRQIHHDWGFGVVQAHRLNAGVISGWRANGSETALQAYRRGLRAFREALDGAPLVVADAPLFASVDVADAVVTSASVLRRADASPLLRAFLSQTGPLTGPGPLSLSQNGQTLDEARAAATVACFGGGIVTLVGDLGSLPPERAAALRVCLPPYTEGALYPIDPCAAEGPYLFGVVVKRRWEDYFLLVALNPLERPVARVVRLAQLGLAPGRYHAYEFWSRTYLGPIDQRLTLERLPAGGCAVVALRPVRDEPQVVGTSLHVSLGAIPLHGAVFDRTACRLHVAVGSAGVRQGTITVAVPRRWLPGPIRGTGGIFTARQTTERLVEIGVEFKDVADIELEFWPGD